MSKTSNEISINLHKFLLPLSSLKRGTLLLCLVMFFAALLFLPEQTDKFDRVFRDFAQKNLARFLSCSPELAIVAIDTETLEGVKQRWPWSREQFASLFTAIKAYQPKAIILDIVFQQPENSDGGIGDEILTRTIKELGNIALIGFMEEETTDTGKQKRQFRSLKNFRDAAFCDGYIHSFIDNDAKIRTFSIRDAKLIEDGCLLKVARKTRATPEAIDALSRLPEKSHIIFARKNGGIPIYRGLDLIEGRLTGDILKDKIVLVGATAQVLHDYHETCLGLMSGPEILTHTMDTIITGRIAKPDNRIISRIILILLGVLVSTLFALRKRFNHELVSISIYLLSIVVLYHLLTMLYIFPPLSCFFITWAFLGIAYNLLKKFIEMVEQQISKAESQRAGQIQAELFPDKFIVTDTYSIRGACMPCDATGGDFYDYFELEDKNLVFVLGDVAGHGFSAAILTIMAKTTIQLLRRKNMASPETIVETLNQVIFELIKKKKFMTLAVGHINVQTHQLNMVLAGHLPPVVISASGALLELRKDGFPMGVVAKLPIKSVQYAIQPGDSIVLATDGIVEALNWKDQQYTFPVWYNFLQTTMPSFSPASDLKSLLTGVNEHKAGRNFDDDVTFLVVQRHRESL